MESISRRSVLLGGATAGAFTLSTVVRNPVAAGLPGAGPPSRGEVFTLGVASGDPTPDGVVLWTRLATNPLAEDGMGGMPDKSIPVQWEVAEDARSGRVVQRGEAQAAPQLGHSSTCACTGASRGADWRHSTCSTPGSTGMTRRATTSARRITRHGWTLVAA